MKKIDLIAIDIDGTLVNSKKEITPAVKKAVLDAKNQGKQISWSAQEEPLIWCTNVILDELGLNNQDNQYVVSFNGAVVESTSGQVIFKQG